MSAVDRRSFGWGGVQGPSDPVEVERGKERAAGPLGHQMASFAERFVVPVTFGENPQATETPTVRMASLALVRIEERALGITCHHVIKRYREWRREGAHIDLQLGNWHVDPDSALIDEDEDLDLVTLDLSDAPTTELSIRGPVEFFQSRRWPPGGVAADEFVSLGGYPAQFRLQSGRDVVEHAYWGLGTTIVTSVGTRSVYCAFERELWVQVHGPDPADLTNLGGMSGSPVFIQRSLAWDFVGIVYQHQEMLDLLRIRPASFIRPDGTLERL